MSYVIEGPQFGVVGWIPFKEFRRGGAGVFHDCIRQESNFFLLDRLRLFWGCKGLFLSGNQPPPPIGFADEQEFANFLDGKNYRCALSFSRVRLQCSDEGRVEDIDWDILEEGNVGFTPYRAGNVINYSQGDGFPSEVAENRDFDHVNIVQTVNFRIGGVGRLLGKVTTNYFPPYAWLTLAYEIHATGRVTAHVSGSHFPNRSYYLDWVRIESDDLELGTRQEVMGFLRTKRRLTGPPARYFRHSVVGRRVEGTL